VVGDFGTILKTTNGAGFPVSSNDMTTKSKTLKIYPNPSSDKITIETSAISTDSRLSIMNLSGQELITHEINGCRTKIDITDLPGGVYFVRLTGERAVQVGKFIRQ